MSRLVFRGLDVVDEVAVGSTDLQHRRVPAEVFFQVSAQHAPQPLARLVIRQPGLKTTAFAVSLPQRCHGVKQLRWKRRSWPEMRGSPGAHPRRLRESAGNGNG